MSLSARSRGSRAIWSNRMNASVQTPTGCRLRGAWGERRPLPCPIMARRKLPSGELENRVLSVLWATDRAMTPREVHAVISAKRDLAYTTVMTILTRLWEKEEVTREKHGRSFAYQPVLGRDERIAQRLQEVLDAADDRLVALSAFVTSLPADAQAALRVSLRESRGRH